MDAGKMADAVCEIIENGELRKRMEMQSAHLFE